MCFEPNSLNDLFVPILCLNDIPMTLVSSNKYLRKFIHDKHEDDEDDDDDDDIIKHVKSLYSLINMLPVVSKHVLRILN